MSLPVEVCSEIKKPSCARIVATIGPASFENLEDIIQYGTIRMNTAFIYGPDDVKAYRKRAQRIRRKAGNRVAILLDIVGPRVKLSPLPKEGIPLKEGEQVSLVPVPFGEAFDLEGTLLQSKVLIGNNFGELGKFVKEGDPILLAEGKMRMKVNKVVDEPKPNTVLCSITKGGLLKKRGINCPKTDLGVEAFTKRDRKNLTDLLVDTAGLFDIVAISFVRTKRDVLELRAFLDEIGHPDIRIMAKIETQRAVDEIEDVAGVSDSLMIARGDLWCELVDPWSITKVTLDLCRIGRAVGIPVVAATQVCSSMVSNPFPTRAEVDEIYFLLSNADCVMGSEEFAIGKYPDKMVEAFHSIGRHVDAEYVQLLRKEEQPKRIPLSDVKHMAVSWSTSQNRHQRRSAVEWAEKSERVVCMVVISDRGAAARSLYREHPLVPLIVITNNASTARYLQLFNVIVVLTPYHHTDQERDIAERVFRKVDFSNLLKRPEGVDQATAILLTNRRLSATENYCGMEEILVHGL